MLFGSSRPSIASDKVGVVLFGDVENFVGSEGILFELKCIGHVCEDVIEIWY